MFEDLRFYVQLMPANTLATLYYYAQTEERLLAVLHDWRTGDRAHRNVCQGHPRLAVWYAVCVDTGFHAVTHAAAIKDAGAALLYAKHVRVTDAVREKVSEDAHWAYYLAHQIEHAPHPVTRRGAAQDELAAYLYAWYVDEQPHPVTRSAMSGGACAYAMYIDKQPHPDTRTAALTEPATAYRYARLIDGCAHDKTRAATLSNPYYAWKYALWVDEASHSITRATEGTFYIDDTLADEQRKFSAQDAENRAVVLRTHRGNIGPLRDTLVVFPTEQLLSRFGDSLLVSPEA